MRRPGSLFFCFVFFSGFFAFVSHGPAFADENVVRIQEPTVAGEFFGVPVSMDNYRFAKAAVMIFRGQWGRDPQTPAELEDRVWEDLLLSYEAYRRHITVSQKEVDEELDKILKAENVVFDRSTDRAAYEKWVMDRTKQKPEVFENQLRHLMQLKRLREVMMDAVRPSVTEEEAYQEYLNEYNTLAVEFVRFDDESEAQAYYQKMKNVRSWARQAKKDPKFALRPGFVSLECLIDLWKIPFKDAYAMLELKPDSVYPPTPVYKGWGVFHTLEKREAEPEKFSELKASYEEQVKRRKQYDGMIAWVEQLKKDAQVKRYTRG